ncbi:MAG: hypothetical protein ACLR4Z_07870 [Butyricicoccaceae bacterium]
MRLRPLAKKYRAALIVLLAGVLLLVSGGREETSDAAQTQTGADSFSLSDFRDAALAAACLRSTVQAGSS